MATRTLRHRTSIGKYFPPRRVTPEEYVARELGVTQGTAHQLMYGERRSNRRAAVIVAGFVQAGQQERSDRWLVEVMAARQGVLPCPLTPELIEEAQLRDLEEDIAENAFRTLRTREAAAEWARKAERQLALNLQVIEAIKAEFEL